MNQSEFGEKHQIGLISPHNRKIIKPSSNTINLSNSIKARSSLQQTKFDNTNPLVEAREALNINQRRIANEDLFDQLMEKALDHPLHEVFEPILKVMFRGDNCILWIDIPENQYLYSPTNKFVSQYSNSLPGFVHKTQSIIQIKDASQAPKGFTIDSRVSPVNSPLFFFPLANRAVVQVVRRSNSGGFNETDMETAQLLMHKFSIYGNALFSVSTLTPLALQLFKESPATLNPLTLIEKHFDCGEAQIWRVDAVKNIYSKFNPEIGDMEIKDEDPTISHAISLNGIENNSDEIKLICTHEINKREIWVGVLSGRGEMFNSSEEAQFRSLLPFLIKFITGFGNESQQKALASRIGDLLNVFSLIACTLNISDLQRIINDQVPTIFDCESVKFVVFSETENPPQSGLISQSLSLNEPFIAENPSKVKGYNPSVDSINNQEPRSLLSSAIRTVQKTVVGYLALFSKKGNNCFDANDSLLLKDLSSFIASSISQSQRIEMMNDISASIAKGDTLKEVLTNISKSSDIKRVVVYANNNGWVKLADAGEIGNPQQEIEAIKNQADCEGVTFYPIKNENQEEIGQFGVNGDLDNIQTYCNVIGTLINVQEKSDISLNEIIDTSKAALASAANSIDLGENVFKYTFQTNNLKIQNYYQLVFKIFGRFRIFDNFNVSNAALFNFLREIKLTKQGADNLQMFASLLLQCRMESTLSNMELFGSLVSCILSDYNCPQNSILVESPEAIVSLSKAVTVMANDGNNIFKSIQQTDLKNIWDLIIDLVVSSDFNNFYNVLNSAEKVIDGENDDEDDNQKYSMKKENLKLFLACAKLSPCVRNKKGDEKISNLATDFFRRCDLTHTSFKDVKSREEIDQEKIFDALFNDAAIPAFKLLSKIDSSLNVISQCVSNNASN